MGPSLFSVAISLSAASSSSNDGGQRRVCPDPPKWELGARNCRPAAAAGCPAPRAARAFADVHNSPCLRAASVSSFAGNDLAERFTSEHRTFSLSRARQTRQRGRDLSRVRATCSNWSASNRITFTRRSCAAARIMKWGWNLPTSSGRQTVRARCNMTASTSWRRCSNCAGAPWRTRRVPRRHLHPGA